MNGKLDHQNFTPVLLIIIKYFSLRNTHMHLAYKKQNSTIHIYIWLCV